MSDEPIKVTKASGFILAYPEEVAEGLVLWEAMMNALDPSKSPLPTPPDPGPNPLWVALLAAAQASPVLAEIVELHEPKATVYPKADGAPPFIVWACHGEPPSGYEWDYADWPCETTAVIAKHLGVDHANDPHHD